VPSGFIISIAASKTVAFCSLVVFDKLDFHVPFINQSIVLVVFQILDPAAVAINSNGDVYVTNGKKAVVYVYLPIK